MLTSGQKDSLDMMPGAVLTSHTLQPSMTCQRHEKKCRTRIEDSAHKWYNHCQLAEEVVLVGRAIGMLQGNLLILY